MAFGKRSAAIRPLFDPASLSTDIASSGTGDRATVAACHRPADARGRIAATALLGILLGFGGVAAGTTLVHASERSGLFNFLEHLFQAPQPQVAEPRPTAKRYASLPDARRITATRTRHYTPRPSLSGFDRQRTRSGAVPSSGPAPRTVGTQTVCVRTCDGYVFPVGRLRRQADVPVHQAACAAACPNAQTALFTLPPGSSELQQAVSLTGQPYLAAAWANVYRQKRVQSCSCQPEGVAAAPLPVDRDATVRVGDIVATEDSAQVVTKLARGQVEVADYRSARGLTRRARNAIDLRIGTMRREADEAAFRRALHAAQPQPVRVRLAEAGAAQLRAIEALPGFSEPSRETAGGQAFTPVRVVAPSPYAP